MAETPADKTSRRPLRNLLGWLKGPTMPPEAGSPEPTGAHQPVDRTRLGHYTIERKLGQGGMGVVYAARDEKLHRTVALKTMSSLSGDETARRRFWREARAAASVNHPNVCQIYEIGEDGDELFIAMEMLEGGPLSERLAEGPMTIAETMPIAIGILEALAALHARGIVHRDLKPSNVFLTPHGVKLLDFGLARPTLLEEPETMPDLTRAGVVMGTPRYMSPEQALGEAVDARSDLFVAGAILFEMLAGRPAFTGNSVMAVLNATIHDQPPALTGSSTVAAVDRVIRRALAKRPSERPASAEGMAEELRQIRSGGDDTAALTHALTRLVVLPFRVLRPDPDTDFLAFSLPDAITTSLAGIGSLVVRSSATAARYAGESPDLKALASDAGVDRVVLGTLLRAGDEVRAVAQLVDAPDGRLIASHTIQSPLGDLFRLQDDIAKRVVEALALPLGGTTMSPPPDAPEHGGAYRLYLRANDLARSYDGLPQARELYEQCVALDPNFAPAWARLGRCHRVIGKFITPSPDSERRAEDALTRALALNPRLTIAHKLYAYLEAESGRCERALERLLGEARRHGNDPELFSGLVHACRYGGLFEQSIAAHDEARRLDPTIETGYEQTVLLTGDIERIVDQPGDPGSGDDLILVIALGLAGRQDEARQMLDRMSTLPRIETFRIWIQHLVAWLDKRPGEMLEHLATLSTLLIFNDPEAIFQEGWLFCSVGEHQRGLAFLQRGVGRGYYAASTLATSPHFDALRGDPAFEALVADAAAGRERALAAFRDAGGERLLGR